MHTIHAFLEILKNNLHIFRICAHTSREHSIQEVKTMTTKELLYVEDVLGHETYFQTQCRDTIGKLQDPELKNCVEALSREHAQLFQGFLGLL